MNDNEIIALYWKRSENAIKETEIKYGKLCTRLANNILNNPSDAEECVSDSYLTVWNLIPEERPQNFSAFISRIVKNLSLKRLEYSTAKKRKPEFLASLDELRDCVSSDDSPEESFDVSLLGNLISVFLENQDSLHRNIFLRRYWYYDSVKSIAFDFQMKEEKVSSILFKTRKKLKKFLEKEGYSI